jgi:hypothetical protein
MSLLRTSAAGLLLAAVALSSARPAAAGGPKKDEKLSVSELSLEVSALYTLYSFKMSDLQLEELKKLAKETAQKPRERKAGPVSDQYRDLLVELRAALIANDDPDQIDNLGEQLDELEKAEAPELDDGVELTVTARREAPRLLRRLALRQLANYIADTVDDIAGPRERLTQALDDAGKLDDKKWKRLRDDTARQIGWLVAGLDEGQAEDVGERVGKVLDRARGLKGKKAQAEREKLEKEALRVIGDIAPTQTLRHVLEHALAELLANPRLEAVLDLRLKAAAAGGL